MLEEALEHLVTGIVDHKDDVAVRRKELRRGEILEVRVHPDDLGRLVWEHLVLVLVSVGVATLLAVPLGVLLFPHPKSRALALGTAGL